MKVIGILIGLVYCFLGLQSAFTISSRDPWTVWPILFLGPFLTLPTSLLSYLSAKPSMWVLAVGSCVSAALALFTYPLSDALFLTCCICAPNVVIATVIIWRQNMMGGPKQETAPASS